MIKIFAEFHGAKRCPELSYALNQTALTPSDIHCAHITDSMRCQIVSLPCTFLPGQNLLEVTQSDKTDDDLLYTQDGFVDHYVEIKEVEIDGIRLESVLFQCAPTFEHSMSQEWQQMMKQKGFDIPKIYNTTTQLRLNGTWTLTFDSPVWLWHTRILLT